MRKKKLIVDDKIGIRMLLCEAMQTDGHRVFQAENGILALEVVVEEQPDLVLLDIKLPGMSGLDVLMSIKKNYPHISVIMMTAYHELNIKEESLELGADAHISKPFDLEEIRQTIKNELRS